MLWTLTLLLTLIRLRTLPLLCALALRLLGPTLACGVRLGARALLAVPVAVAAISVAAVAVPATVPLPPIAAVTAASHVAVAIATIPIPTIAISTITIASIPVAAVTALIATPAAMFASIAIAMIAAGRALSFAAVAGLRRSRRFAAAAEQERPQARDDARPCHDDGRRFRRRRRCRGRWRRRGR